MNALAHAAPPSPETAAPMVTLVVKPYDQLRARLLESLFVMASRAETALVMAMRALVERNNELADQTIRDDSILDHFELEADELCVQLLAMAPLARELRLITVAMKISRNLERIGDEAVSIAYCARTLNQDAPLKPYIDLPLMATISRQMLNAAIGAFIDQRPDRARDLLPDVTSVDELNDQLHRELSSFMIERPSTIPSCLLLIGVGNALERIADHATNIAEDVVYLYEGKDIRHPDRD